MQSQRSKVNRYLSLEYKEKPEDWNTRRSREIGILGAGNIGTTLANRLAEAGHQVKVANLRGLETIPEMR